MIFQYYFLVFFLISFVSGKKRAENLVYLTEKKNYKNVSTPVVIWHGMGDSCCNPISMGRVKSMIQKELPGTYVHSLMLGSNIATDTEHGFLGNMNDLVKEACEKIKKDSYLKDGYNALGFSQGGLFIRAIAQRCPYPKMKNLISIGGPQQGIFGFPYCTGSTKLCRIVKYFLNYGAYVGLVQNSIVQAQYWHDPRLDDEYREKNIFLADLNNEKINNTTYKDNLLKLENMVLVKFSRDEMVVPKDSEWFGFYDSSVKNIISMENTTLYINDRIGLKELSDSKRIHLLTCDGGHLEMSNDFFIKKIIYPFLK
ncbi:Palmitoyl-protein thioesterase 1 [Strongyloides ratti]|uniref:Palmitoyl-protein thioesterase 1 n=1 Tax=Strongyloides ratti TaxID=34506 RepID=A0A090L4D7_STRRB|nr:Palmitoyl-protein thioesterase 1 [Strongyloides ratti]CEF62339.1 Palmitoyl-protein thioesterase 1 [Strongyloides ratti]